MTATEHLVTHKHFFILVTGPRSETSYYDSVEHKCVKCLFTENSGSIEKVRNKL